MHAPLIIEKLTCINFLQSLNTFFSLNIVWIKLFWWSHYGHLRIGCARNLKQLFIILKITAQVKLLFIDFLHEKRNQQHIILVFCNSHHNLEYNNGLWHLLKLKHKLIIHLLFYCIKEAKTLATNKISPGASETCHTCMLVLPLFSKCSLL